MSKSWLKNLKREKSQNFDISNYLRLDKNERIIHFDKIFLNTLKKKLNTFQISSYPNIEKIKNLISKSPVYQTIYLLDTRFRFWSENVL